LPLAEEADEEVALELAVKDLREEVQVADEGRLQDDWDVAGIEELDGVGESLSTSALAVQLKFDTEALEIDDDEDDEDCGEQIAYIRRVLPIESLLQGVELVRLGQQEVEESNDGALELSALLRADGDGRETLPEDDFTDVGGNEEGDAAAKTVALLEELIEEDNDDAGQGELEDDDDAVDHADFVDGTVHAREKVSESLTDGDND
jgi:hypothetical protein